jgi:hypothetical protein
MSIKRSVNSLLVCVLFLSACAAPQPTAAPTTPPTQATSLTDAILTATAAISIPSPTGTTAPSVSAPTETTVPSVPSATTAPVSPSLPDISTLIYLDDRSTPAALMLSYFNAINKRSYLQAYSYYTNYAALGTLDEFTNGYSETQSVSVVFGNISSDGAAGSIYFTVPMVLNATTTANVQQKFAACYVLRLSQPGNYGAPPITPMHIERGTAQSIPLTTLDSAALSFACPSPDFPTGPNASPAAVETLTDLIPANYIDNRSDAVALMSSYLNAINRQEYVRAFSYWQTPASTYDAFAASYATTASITAQFGTVTPDAGAGQVYYSLPVALKSSMTDGSLKTFVGCYVMHLAQPGFQGTVPFQPLGITNATVNLVDNSADLTSLLATACQ